MQNTTLSVIEQEYISVPEMAQAAGVKNNIVHSWLRYFRYMEFEHLFGKPLVRRDEWERFKTEHPELIKTVEVAQ